jgi:hypothetical protein
MLNMDLSVHDFDGRAFDTLRRELNLASASSSAPGADELVIFEIYSWCDARWRKIQPGEKRKDAGATRRFRAIRSSSCCVIPGRSGLEVAYVGGIDLSHSRHDDAGHVGDLQAQTMAAVYGDLPPIRRRACPGRPGPGQRRYRGFYDLTGALPRCDDQRLSDRFEPGPQRAAALG